MKKFRNIILILLVVLTSFYVVDFTVKPLKIVSSQELTKEETVAGSEALTKLFSDVKHRKYTNKLKHSDYTLIVRDDCVNRGTMTWTKRADEYNGTRFDYDPDPEIGRIYVQEIVKPPSTVITICRDTAFKMSESTRAGGEHLILFYNDIEEFKRTGVHLTQELEHPIIPNLW
mgnify:CR=1 FL=1